MNAEFIEKTIKIMPSNNIDDYIKMGDLAGKNGDENESLRWYFKGLRIAQEKENKEKIDYISRLIITFL